MHLIQKLTFEQIEANNHKICRRSCEDKADNSNLCMFAVFDEHQCYHYTMNLHQNINQERAVFIPTKKLPSEVRIMFVRYIGGILSNVVFHESRSLIDDNSGLCSTLGISIIC